MFIFKKLAGNLLSPLSIAYVILMAAVLFLWFSSRKKTGKVLATAGLALFLMLGYHYVPNQMIKALETRYRPYSVDEEENRESFPFVAVLGCGHSGSSNLPPNIRLNEIALMRLVEGVRIHGLHPESRMIFSGAGPKDKESSASVMKKAAIMLGVSPDNIIVEGRPRDTREEARHIRRIVKDNRFILVTSALHMHRSMSLFKGLGMNPQPAPADFLYSKKNINTPGDFFPHPDNLEKAHFAVHEYLGMLWAWLNGQI
jgi:uncharacterized SAM-binding protein YcdF (DUF218 family)